MRVLIWLAVLAAAVALRLLCLNAEFWLDEILSFDLSREVTTPLSVFALRSDNNHPLNTLWLSLWRADSPLWCLRLHSLVAGVVGVALIGVAGRRLDAETPALVLAAGCWWLVVASVDARGYAMAVAFALAAFLAMNGYLARPRWSMLATFWVAVPLAFLSHLTFLHAYLGLVAWSARGGSGREQLRRLTLLHGVPAVFLIALYAGFIRGLKVEGGPPADVPATLLSLFSLGFGGPRGGAPAYVVGVVWAAFMALGLIDLFRRRDPVAVFFLVTCVLAPGVFLLTSPAFLFERYFLVSFTFGLLLAARALAVRWPTMMHAVVILLFAFTIGSANIALRYAWHGRGDLRAPINQFRSLGGRVAGDHDFRVGRSLRFRAPDVEFVPKEKLPPGGVEWLLIHRLDRDRRPPPADVEADAAGNEYRWDASYPAEGPAGWGWFVYRRSDKPPK